jgi:lipopolysaccharide export system permease protein
MIGLTLARYFSLRFLEQILIVFLGISALSFLIDFVDLLRRTSEASNASALSIGLMAALRTPVASEQILPFAVLFGTMAAFVNLTRKLELVIARAAGVSVWGFLVPPLVIALLLGVLSVVAYNPMAAGAKQKADALEIQLFGKAGASKDQRIWLRQSSVDGKATISAARILDEGRRLQDVVVMLNDPHGVFLERVEAPQATLIGGAWRLEKAHIIREGEPVEDSSAYMLATDMDANDVLRELSSKEAIGFWELPAFRERARESGLDATPYEMRRQTLLARPLMLLAMVLIAAAFSLRFFRFGGVGKMIAGGVGAGFVLYVATKMVGDMGGAGVLSPGVAAWSPALVGGLLGALALLHQEDG